MALTPTNEQHALQIQAGTLGRKAGHEFEDTLTSKLNSLSTPHQIKAFPATNKHLFISAHEQFVLNYICSRKSITNLEKVSRSGEVLRHFEKFRVTHLCVRNRRASLTLSRLKPSL